MLSHLLARRLLAAALLALGLLTGPARADDFRMPALPAALQAAVPVNLLPPDPARQFELRDGIHSGERRASFAATGTLHGKPVFTADNPKGAANYDGVQALWRLPHAIRKGEVLLARFAARALQARQESGEAEGAFAFQRQRGGSGRVVQTFSVGPEWTLIHVPIVALDDAAAGESVAYISFAHLEQRFEITGLELQSFGDRVQRADLPITRFSYYGRAADAPWRAAALKRIEELRTAPLTIRVVDAAGRPVPGADVKAELVQPEFLWGSAVSVDRLVGEGEDAERYRRKVVELFDTAVIENGLKWPQWRQPAARERTLKALDWLAAQGLRIKGHNLAWPGWKFTPPDIAGDPAQRERIAELVEAHIRDVMAATKGRLIGWDVINEPVHERDYYAHMPRERVAQWFKMAAQAEPGLQLTLNEYGMLNRSSSPLFIREFLDFAEMLEQQGARIDVMGVQGHVGQTPRPPTEVLKDLDLFAAAGRRVQVTEFDINTPDEELQGDYTRDFLIAVYSHPAVTGFIQWGFWQGAHWKPDAAMFRRDWSEKPNLKPWRELVLGAWKTRIAAASGDDGRLAARGHRGRYVVSAEQGGQRAQAELVLGKSGAEVVLKLAR